MTSDEFDLYRKEYPSRVSEWHSRLYRDYPDQNHFSAETAKMFFDIYAGGSVVEIGGWRGEMADLILPHDEIVSWDNYEVCSEAANTPVCFDPKYTAHVAHVLNAPTCDTLILSHVIEHLSDDQARHLLATTDAEMLYIDAPLGRSGTDWSGETCFHVLNMGWDELNDAIQSEGYSCCGVFGSVRWYER